MVKNILLLAGLAGSLCVSAFAQADTTRWLVVTQVAADKAVQVQLNSGRTVKGKLIRGDDSGMVLQDSKGETKIARGEIREIRVREGRGRGRGGRAKLGVIIGGLVGSGFGAAGGASFGALEAPETGASFAAGVTGGGAGIGVAIGAAIPDRYVRVYTASGAGSTPEPHSSK